MGCDVVFDEDGDPVKWTPKLAILSLLIQHVRSLQEERLWSCTDDRSEMVIVALDLCEIYFDEMLAGYVGR